MRLIDADALINTLNEEKINFIADINYIILNAPTIDAEPTRHGKWIDVKGSNGKDYRKCSECLHTQEITGLLNYCPVCGARMDKDASKYEESEINPCRGCEDYDGKGGCLSNGGCANVNEVEE